MTDTPQEPRELVPLSEAQRLCGQKLGMSALRFWHELAEHARGRGGIPWHADAGAVGVPRAALEARLAAEPPDASDEHEPSE